MKKSQVAYIGLNNLFGRVVTSLLKQSPGIKNLIIYDDKNPENVTEFPVFTTNTSEQCKVTTFFGRETLPFALSKADIVVIGEEFIKNSSTNAKDRLTSTGARAVDYAKIVAAYSPTAILVIAASPINYVVPVFARVLEAAGCFEPNRLLGATSADTLRASTLLASKLKIHPQKVILPVIGGASPSTRVPLFSQSHPASIVQKESQVDLVTKIKLFDINECDEAEIIERAYATVRFIHSIIAARWGKSPVPEVALTRNDQIPDTTFFSMPIIIGKNGIQKTMKLPKLIGFEEELLKLAIDNINIDVEKATGILDKIRPTRINYLNNSMDVETNTVALNSNLENTLSIGPGEHVDKEQSINLKSEQIPDSLEKQNDYGFAGITKDSTSAFSNFSYEEEQENHNGSDCDSPINNSSQTCEEAQKQIENNLVDKNKNAEEENTNPIETIVSFDKEEPYIRKINKYIINYNIENIYNELDIFSIKSEPKCDSKDEQNYQRNAHEEANNLNLQNSKEDLELKSSHSTEIKKNITPKIPMQPVDFSASEIFYIPAIKQNYSENSQMDYSQSVPLVPNPKGVDILNLELAQNPTTHVQVTNVASKRNSVSTGNIDKIINSKAIDNLDSTVNGCFDESLKVSNNNFRKINSSIKMKKNKFTLQLSLGTETKKTFNEMLAAQRSLSHKIGETAQGDISTLTTSSSSIPFLPRLDSLKEKKKIPIITNSNKTIKSCDYVCSRRELKNDIFPSKFPIAVENFIRESPLKNRNASRRSENHISKHSLKHDGNKLVKEKLNAHHFQTYSYEGSQINKESELNEFDDKNHIPYIGSETKINLNIPRSQNKTFSVVDKNNIISSIEKLTTENEAEKLLVNKLPPSQNDEILLNEVKSQICCLGIGEENLQATQNPLENKSFSSFEMESTKKPEKDVFELIDTSDNLKGDHANKTKEERADSVLTEDKIKIPLKTKSIKIVIQENDQNNFSNENDIRKTNQNKNIESNMMKLSNITTTNEEHAETLLKENEFDIPFKTKLIAFRIQENEQRAARLANSIKLNQNKTVESKSNMVHPTITNTEDCRKTNTEEISLRAKLNLKHIMPPAPNNPYSLPPKYPSRFKQNNFSENPESVNRLKKMLVRQITLSQTEKTKVAPEDTILIAKTENDKLKNRDKKYSQQLKKFKSEMLNSKRTIANNSQKISITKEVLLNPTKPNFSALISQAQIGSKIDQNSKENLPSSPLRIQSPKKLDNNTALIKSNKRIDKVAPFYNNVESNYDGISKIRNKMKGATIADQQLAETKVNFNKSAAEQLSLPTSNLKLIVDQLKIIQAKSNKSVSLIPQAKTIPNKSYSNQQLPSSKINNSQSHCPALPRIKPPIDTTKKSNENEKKKGILSERKASPSKKHVTADSSTQTTKLTLLYGDKNKPHKKTSKIKALLFAKQSSNDLQQQSQKTSSEQLSSAQNEEINDNETIATPLEPQNLIFENTSTNEQLNISLNTPNEVTKPVTESPLLANSKFEQINLLKESIKAVKLEQVKKKEQQKSNSNKAKLDNPFPSWEPIVDEFIPYNSVNATFGERNSKFDDNILDDLISNKEEFDFEKSSIPTNLTGGSQQNQDNNNNERTPKKSLKSSNMDNLLEKKNNKSSSDSECRPLDLLNESKNIKLLHAMESKNGNPVKPSTVNKTKTIELNERKNTLEILRRNQIPESFMVQAMKNNLNKKDLYEKKMNDLKNIRYKNHVSESVSMQAKNILKSLNSRTQPLNDVSSKDPHITPSTFSNEICLDNNESGIQENKQKLLDIVNKSFLSILQQSALVNGSDMTKKLFANRNSVLKAKANNQTELSKSAKITKNKPGRISNNGEKTNLFKGKMYAKIPKPNVNVSQKVGPVKQTSFLKRESSKHLLLDIDSILKPASSYVRPFLSAPPKLPTTNNPSLNQDSLNPHKYLIQTKLKEIFPSLSSSRYNEKIKTPESQPANLNAKGSISKLMGDNENHIAKKNYGKMGSNDQHLTHQVPPRINPTLSTTTPQNISAPDSVITSPLIKQLTNKMGDIQSAQSIKKFPWNHEKEMMQDGSAKKPNVSTENKENVILPTDNNQFGRLFTIFRQILSKDLDVEEKHRIAFASAPQSSEGVTESPKANQVEGAKSTSKYPTQINSKETKPETKLCSNGSGNNSILGTETKGSDVVNYFIHRDRS